MQIKGRGNVVAIALSALAVVLAGGGTAVAVASTTTISDPKVPARVARVDPSGRLTTVGAGNVINISEGSFMGSGTDHFVVSPTTATIAVTHIGALANPTNTASYSVSLLTAPVNTDGTCNTTNATKGYSLERVAPGGTFQDDYATPIIVKPVGTAKYCIDLYVFRDSGSANANDFVNVQFDAYVTAGVYTGTGTSATAGKVGAKDVSGKTVVGS